MGYGIFAAFNYLLAELRFGYFAAALLSNVIAITIAYINYKFFVFRTTGNYLREYLRFYLVYGVAIAFNLVLLPVLIEVFGINSYLAAALLLPVGVLVSFAGHNTISFKTADPVPE